jgi:uncharacterized protein (DUF302 family)|tara:strand:- start:129 stop:515 length:387 start_codon:yes stop_codon:yes gene_type:complete
MDYGHKKVINGTILDVENLLREKLLNNGFGVITEIDIKEKLEDKLGVDFRNYKILGSCHPPSAYESLDIDLNVGILLPCNFVVWDNKDGSATVATIKASSLLSVLKNSELNHVGEKVDKLVSSVMDQL